MNKLTRLRTIHRRDNCGGIVDIEEFGDGDCLSCCNKCGKQAPENMNILNTIYYFGGYWREDDYELKEQ